MERSNAAAISELVGKKFQVLDKGHVILMDVMGSDEDIVEAARTSFGKGTRSVSDDETLLRYLMRHRHSTPFEMCLSGDTRIPTYPCPGAKQKHYTIRQIAEAFSSGQSGSWAQLIKIRTVNPETGVISKTKIKRAWKTGEREVFRVRESSVASRSIVLTNNHPILCPDGSFQTLENLRVGDRICLNGRPAVPSEIEAEVCSRRSKGGYLKDIVSDMGIPASTVQKILARNGLSGKLERRSGFFKKPEGSHLEPHAIARRKIGVRGQCRFPECQKTATETHHLDENPWNNSIENLAPLCAKHHRVIHNDTPIQRTVATTIASVERIGVEDVYDMEVESPYHTFVAEGFVVHNCEIKLHVRVPMDTWRQWIRHRTACLTGDTLIQFDLPGGIERRGNQLYTLSVGEIYKRFQPSKNGSRPDKQGNPYRKRERVQAMKARSLNEETFEVRHTQIVDIWQTGEKPTWEVRFEGHSVKASKDHLFLTENGWMKLADAADLSENGDSFPLSAFSYVGPGVNTGMEVGFNQIDTDSEAWAQIPGGWEDYYEVSDQGRVRRIVGGRGSRSFGRCKVLTVCGGHAVVSLNRPGVQQARLVHQLVMEAFVGPRPQDMEVCHEDGNGLNNSLDNLRYDTPSSNAMDRVRDGATTRLSRRFVMPKIKFSGTAMTYDIEVAGPWHNFSADGFVVHNSVNEYSTRYSEAIDDKQETKPDEWRIQSTSNRQGSGGFVTDWPGGERWSGVKEHYTPGDCLSAAEAGFHAAAAQLYEDRLAFGVAREQARKDLPLSTYTEAVWKCDLRNTLGFLSLRMDEHAQLEIRSYANVIGEEIVAKLFPLTWRAFLDYELMSIRLSALDIRAIRKMMRSLILLDKADDNPLLERVFSNKRERDECRAKLERLGITWGKA